MHSERIPALMALPVPSGIPPGICRRLYFLLWAGRRGNVHYGARILAQSPRWSLQYNHLDQNKTIENSGVILLQLPESFAFSASCSKWGNCYFRYFSTELEIQNLNNNT